MKKILSLFLFLLVFFNVTGTPPNLEIEKLFDGRYNANPKVETTIMINNGMFYRGFTIKGDSDVISEIEKAIDKDKERSSNYTFHQEEKGTYISIQFLNNGEPIFSGFETESPGNGFFYIQAKEKAFK